MSVSASTLRRLAELQLAPEQMAGVLGILAELAEVEEEARAKEIERKRRDRDRKATGKIRGNSTESDGKSAEIPAEIQSEPLSLPPSPQTPQPPTHTRESITTREADVREEAAFDRFWAMYPRKTAKADARKAFGRAWKKLPPFEEETILLGALVNVKATWTDAQFIPHAATWLNGERWTDEPAEVSPISPRGPRNERPNGHSPAATSRATRRGVWAEVLAEECGPPTGLRAVSWGCRPRVPGGRRR